LATASDSAYRVEHPVKGNRRILAAYCSEMPDRFRRDEVTYQFSDCVLGTVLVAQTATGVCAVLFGDSEQELVEELRSRTRGAELQVSQTGSGPTGSGQTATTAAAVVALIGNPAEEVHVQLDIRGTEFQQKVWQQLLAIPCGSTMSYSQVAAAIGQPTAARAVAGACSANPIAVVIPCHRVIAADGGLGGYRWGIERKLRLLQAEQSA
jgi:AraC family transcriptional regulator of adaptative response/methylated-DNA-[protein]-cysteine methyltransferase